MAEDIMKVLLRRLELPEDVLFGLLQIKPVLKKWQEDSLRYKLEWIHEMISDIPMDDPDGRDLLYDWRNMVVVMWTKYCELERPSDLAEENKKKSKQSRSRQREIEEGFRRSPPRTRVPSKFSDSQSVSSHDSSVKSKESIRGKLEQVFSGEHLKFENSTDIESLQKLLIEISKLETLISAHHTDRQLQTYSLELMCLKLPIDMSENFHHDCNHGQRWKTVRHLKEFLCEQVVKYYAEQHAEEEDFLFESERKVRGAFGGNICRYCKLAGHQQAKCPKIKDMLCFQCYKLGHKAKNCPMVCNGSATGGGGRIDSNSKKCYNCGHFGHFARNCPY